MTTSRPQHELHAVEPSPQRRAERRAAAWTAIGLAACAFGVIAAALFFFGPSRDSLADDPPAARDTVTAPRAAAPDTPAEPARATPAANAAVEPPLPDDLWTRQEGEDWPIFLGPRGDGRSQEKLPEGWSHPWKLRWHVEVGEGYGIGTVSRGRLFQFDRVDDDARVRCLRAETGEELWTFRYRTSYRDLYDYDGGPRCSPLVDGGRLYLFGVEGLLHCLRADTGELLWKVDTSRDFGVVQNFFGVGANPVVHGDLLWVMVGGSPEASQTVAPGRLDLVKPNGSCVVAFDKRTGEVRHKLGNDLASYASLTTATIDGRPWCFAFARSGLLGFDPRNGKLDFEFPWRAKSLESVNASTPVVVGKQVLISETYGVGAALLEVAPGEAKPVWQDQERSRDQSLQTHWNTPVHHEGHIYACSGRHTHTADLRCVDWATGKVRWTRDEVSRCSLTYIDGHLITLGEYGDLFVIRANPEKFEPVLILEPPEEDGRRLLKYPCWAAPVISHHLVFVRGEGRLLCFDLEKS